MSTPTTFWRLAGLSYNQYVATASQTLRAALKEPTKSKAVSREGFAYNLSLWKEGKQGAKSRIQTLSKADTTMEKWSQAIWSDLKDISIHGEDIEQTLLQRIHEIHRRYRFGTHQPSIISLEPVSKNKDENVCDAIRKESSKKPRKPLGEMKKKNVMGPRSEHPSNPSSTIKRSIRFASINDNKKNFVDHSIPCILSSTKLKEALEVSSIDYLSYDKHDTDLEEDKVSILKSHENWKPSFYDCSRPLRSNPSIKASDTKDSSKEIPIMSKTVVTSPDRDTWNHSDVVKHRDVFTRIVPDSTSGPSFCDTQFPDASDDYNKRVILLDDAMRDAQIALKRANDYLPNHR